MIDAIINRTVDMKRPVADYDDMGGVTYTLTTFSSSHPCRISESVPSEIRTGPTEYAEATAMIYTLPGTDFARDDEAHDGDTVYKVLGVRKPSNPNHHTELVCKVVSNGT